MFTFNLCNSEYNIIFWFSCNGYAINVVMFPVLVTIILYVFLFDLFFIFLSLSIVTQYSWNCSDQVSKSAFLEQTLSFYVSIYVFEFWVFWVFNIWLHVRGTKRSKLILKFFYMPFLVVASFAVLPRISFWVYTALLNIHFFLSSSHYGEKSLETEIINQPLIYCGFRKRLLGESLTTFCGHLGYKFQPNRKRIFSSIENTVIYKILDHQIKPLEVHVIENQVLIYTPPLVQKLMLSFELLSWSEM